MQKSTESEVTLARLLLSMLSPHIISVYMTGHFQHNSAHSPFPNIQLFSEDESM